MFAQTPDLQPARVSAPAPQREIELDFIRGLAILLVIDFHSPQPILLAPFLWLGFQHFGWVGVDLFFVLSGFLVGGLLVKEWITRGRIDTRHFLIRRGLKIWPQYYVYLAAILLTGHRTPHDTLGNLLNIQNYTSGIPHTWSLAVEEHAYMLLALLLGIAAHFRARMRHVFAFIAVICVATVALRFALAGRGFPFLQQTHTRIDAIFYGVLLAITYHSAPRFFGRLQRLRWLWFTVVAASLIYFRFEPQKAIWSEPLRLLFAEALAVALLFLLYCRRETNRSAPYRWVASIGVYSYGIYLWHVSTLAYVTFVANRLPYAMQAAWNAVACYAFAIAIGIFFTRLVELPALRVRDNLFPRRVESAVGIPADFEGSILTTGTA